MDRRDATGRRHRLATTATSKGAAMALLADLERQAERARLGLEARPSDSEETLAELCQWWAEKRAAGRCEVERRQLACHVTRAPIGRLALREVTARVLEDHFGALQAGGLAPASVNHVRGTLRTVINKARKAGLWTGSNPVCDTEPRRVPRRIYDTLTLEEAERLLPHVPADWRGFFAAAVYGGLRKGECAGLRKADVDLERGSLTIRASYDRDTTKGGHSDVIPLPEPLRPYVEAGLRTPGAYLFGAPDGSMRKADSQPQILLRRALGRAGLVTGYEHRCRRQRCGFKATHADAAPRDCPTCGMRLWPVPLPRALRFHDLRHSCATILLRAGVDIHRVQRILRHASVTTTAGTYAHLAVEDLRAGMEAAFGPAARLDQPADTHRESMQSVAVAGGMAQNGHSDPPDGSEPSARDSQTSDTPRVFLAPRAGLEPATRWLTATCSAG